jgi:hypothetical protein
VPAQAKILRINLKNNNTNEEEHQHIFILSSPIIISKNNADLSDQFYTFSIPKVEEQVLQLDRDKSVPIDIDTQDLTDTPESEDEQNVSVINNDTDNINENIPIDISNYQCFESETHVFKFSKPTSINLIKENANIETNKSLYSENIALTKKSTITPEKAITIKFPEKTTTFICPEKANTIKCSEKATNSCKSCWIFKKPMCENCRSNNGDKNLKTFEPSKPCKSCWLFKHSKECGICKRPANNDFLRKDSELEIPVIKNVEVINEKVETEDNAIVAKIPKKRKIDVKPFVAKKSRWQCNICLTENSKREQCLCCDSPRFLNAKKPAFLFRESAFTINKSKNDLPHITAESNIQELKTAENIITVETTRDNDESKHLINNSFVETSTNLPKLYPKNIENSHDDVKTVITHDNKMAEHTKLQENNIFFNVQSFLKLPQEEMDICEDMPVHKVDMTQIQNLEPITVNYNTQTSVQKVDMTQIQFLQPIAENFNIEPVQKVDMAQIQKFQPIVNCNAQPVYQFNIGTSLTDNKNYPRKTRKAVRRMTTSFHK